MPKYGYSSGVINRLSLKNQSPEINLYARLAFWLFALLLLTKFSPIGAGLTVLVVATQVFIGIQLLSSFRVTDQLSALSRIGLGFCLGATLSTIVYVVAVTVTAVYVAVCSQVVLLCIAYFAQRKLSKTDQLQLEPEEIAVVKWLAVAALAGLSPDWFWPLPVALVLGLAFAGWNLVRERSLWLKSCYTSLCLGIGVIVWIQVLNARPRRPWFPDDQFGEIWSYSLGKWGLSHNPMLMGEDISYHWFSFAWVGLLSNFSTVTIEVSLAHFAPMVIAVGCSILGYSIVRSFIRNSMLAVFALCVAFVVDTERFFRGFGFHAFQLSSFSQFFSLCLGLSITLIVLRIPLQNSLQNFILIATLLFGLIGSKISSGATIFLGLSCVFVYEIIADKKSLKNSVVFVAVLVVVAILSFVFFLGNPENRSASVIRRPGWTVGNIGDLIHVYNSSLLKYLPILILLTFALGGLGFMTLLNIKNLSAKFGTQRAIGAYLVGCYVASLSQMWIAQADGSNTVVADADNTLYAFQFATSIAVIVGVANVFGMFENSLVQKFSKRFGLFLSLVALLVVWGTRSWGFEFSGSYATPFLTSIRPAMPLLLGLLIASMVYFVWRSMKGFAFITFVSLFVVSSLIISGGYIFVANYYIRSSRQQSEWRSADVANKISVELANASDWIKQYSNDAEIVSMKNDRQLISVLTDRRDFAGFPITIRLNGLNSNQEKFKRKQLDRFAKSGDCTSAEFLREYGLSLFLVDLTNVQTPDIKRCAGEVFRNRTIVIYSLNESQN